MRIVKLITLMITITLMLHETCQGLSLGEYYKGYGGTHYKDESGEYYTWLKYQDAYYQNKNTLETGYFPSIEAATAYANSKPEINGFFHVKDGVWTTQVIDYATDTELLYEPGYTAFYSDINGGLISASGTHAFFKQKVILRPKHYEQDQLRTYLEKHPEILNENAAPHLEMNVSLENALELSDNDPLITHFIIMQNNTTFYTDRKFGIGYRKTKDTIIFFHEFLPSWLQEYNTYNGGGGIWIYSKKRDIQMFEDSTPEYLYKIISQNDWEQSHLRDEVVKSSMDEEFIHLATKDQLNSVAQKFWNDRDYIILKLATNKLVGRLIYETNPGGSNLYYHLYEGSIPLDAIVEIDTIHKK